MKFTFRSSFLLFIILCSTASGTILKQHKRSCGDGYPAGATETWTFFQDDCTGKYYSIWVTCSGSHYMNTPEPRWDIYADPLAGDPFPPNFWELLSNADMTTSGATCGYFLITDHKTPVFFYNLNNPAEIAEAEAAWERESSGGGMLD